MPEAIATSKRKFHKLLDSITNASTTSLPPPSSDATSTSTTLTARQKLDIASERARKRIRPSTSSASLASSLLHSRNPSTMSLPHKMPASPAPTSKDKTPPNFSPWSQETFLARLKTFSRVSLWHPKPEAINEVEWAKRGWVCVDVNTVACKGGCEKRIVVKLEAKVKELKNGHGAGDHDDAGEYEDDESLEHLLTERYKDEIVEGHSENCLWRKAACKDDIYRLSLVRPAIWQPELRKRFHSLLHISNTIKDVSFKSFDLPASERLLAELPPVVIDSKSGKDSSIQSTALAVALHGWRGTSESHAELLNCDACFQRIGLWMYQPGYKASRASDDDEEASESNGTVSIDLVEMHREHCPWRNTVSQKATGGLSGMNASEVLHKIVSTYAREQRRRSEEQAAGAEKEHEVEEAADDQEVEQPKRNREEIDRLDKERETKLNKLKRMFTIKRPTKPVAKTAV